MPLYGYDPDPNVKALADYLSANPDVARKVWGKKLEVAASTSDDLTALEGDPESPSPIWRNKDLTVTPGQTVVISTMSTPGGPGARGEQNLQGRESKVRLGAYKVYIEFWRDAVALTKKQIKMLAAGPMLETKVMAEVAKKLGRQRQRDMLLKLRNQAIGNVIRPNARTSLHTITKNDVLTPSFLNEVKVRAQTRGARPISVVKGPANSPVLKYMPFATLNALSPVRNSDTYQNAALHGAERDNLKNPLMSGKLVPWNGMEIFEHTVLIDPDADDVDGSPLEPLAILRVAIAAGSASVAIRATSETEDDKTPLYFCDFLGYDYKWYEEQAAVNDTNSYYFWIVNPPDAATDPNKACLYKYTGNANIGTKITGFTERLGPANAGSIQKQTMGGITWDANEHTQVHGVGSYIIPASPVDGAPLGWSLLLGAGSACRAYGEMEAEPIRADWDYKFVKGFGYESCYGQSASLDTTGKPRNYMLIEHCVDREGIPVPTA